MWSVYRVRHRRIALTPKKEEEEKKEESEGLHDRQISNVVGLHSRDFRFSISNPCFRQIGLQLKSTRNYWTSRRYFAQLKDIHLSFQCPRMVGMYKFSDFMNIFASNMTL